MRRGTSIRIGTLLWIATAIACRSVGDAPTVAAPAPGSGSGANLPPKTSNGDASATSDASANLAAATPTGPMRWGTRAVKPTPDAPAYVIDGYCTLADVSFLGNTTLVKYGEHSAGTVARMTDDGSLVDDEALSKGNPEAFKYGRPIGEYPNALFWPIDLGGRGGSYWQVARFDAVAGWKTTFKEEDPEVDVLGQYGAGVLAVKRDCRGASACRTLGVVAIGETTPTLASDGFQPLAFHAWPDKSVVAVGDVCTGEYLDKCVTEARVFVPGAGRTVHVLGKNLSGPSLLARRPNDVLAAFDTVVLRYDGSSWKPAPDYAAPKGSGRLSFLGTAPDGAVWAQSEKGGVFRKKDEAAAWQDVSPPNATKLGYEYAPQVDGVASGDVWAVRDKRLYHAPAGADVKWQPVDIHKSPLSGRTSPPAVAGVRVRSPGDVWINVTYTETYGTPTRFEKRRALLRTGPVQETRRCRARDNVTSERRGFEAWPPRADASCTTPAVVLGRGKLDHEGFPRTRALLKGKGELGQVELIEVAAEGSPYIVARVKDFEAAKTLSNLVVTKVWNVPVEMVCADPDGPRVQVDAKTGSVIGGADAGAR